MTNSTRLNSTFTSPALAVSSTLEHGLCDHDAYDRILLNGDGVCPRALAMFFQMEESGQNLNDNHYVCYILSLWGRGLITLPVAIYGASWFVSFSIAPGTIELNEAELGWLRSTGLSADPLFEEDRICAVMLMISGCKSLWFLKSDIESVVETLKAGRTAFRAMLGEKEEVNAA